MVPLPSEASGAGPGLLKDIYSAGRWALGSRLRAPAAPPAVLALAARLPAHMPWPRSGPERARRGAGRGTPPAVGRGLAPDRGPPGCAPTDPPQSRAESSVPAGRRPPRARPLSALRPPPSALCCGRLPAFRGPAPDSPGRGARPPPSSPAGSPRPGSVPNWASAADHCAQPQTRPAGQGRVPGPALLHFSSKPALGARRSRLAAARRLHSRGGERGRETESG